MKKLLVLLLVALMFSCAMETTDVNTGDSGKQSAVSAPDMSAYSNKDIQLVKFSSYTHTKYGMSQIERTFFIRVKKVSAEKTVYVHHETTNGEWVDLEASYVSEAGEGYELYKLFDYGMPHYGYSISTRFAVKMVTDVKEYWDNNNGVDYNFSSSIGTWLADGINVSLQSAYFYNSSYGSVDIRNISYAKDVTIVYSYDDWKTVKTVKAVYQGPTYSYGYATVKSPNIYNIERWTFNTETDMDASAIQFAVSYSVDGKVYWDNNFGMNYKFEMNK